MFLFNYAYSTSVPQNDFLSRLKERTVAVSNIVYAI
jgi:hypothetical protein